MKRKQVISVIMSGMLSASLAFSAAAAENISVDVNGSVVEFEDQAPIIVNERTLIPLRGTFEALGADVSWNADTKTVTVTSGDTVITLIVGNSIMTVETNGTANTVQLEAMPVIENSRVLIPVRAVSEALGAVVSWDSETSRVSISTEESEESTLAFDKIDNTKWQYNAEDDVYWQIGIQYCENPVDLTYETMGVFVPGAYMNGVDNGNGTYTCEINTENEVGGYTAETAPMVIPVNTPGYSAMKAPTDYVSGVAEYTNAGFVYVNAGCRGRDHGAPAGVTDLKAAVRYIRYNAGNVAGSNDRIFTFGMSGGGAQSSLMGATGNSDLYTPYLQAIGAVEGVSDAVAGSMCWCPITNLDYANEAYEWNLGVSRSDLDDETQALSDAMAEAYAKYINELGIKDENGNVLTLEQSESGIYQSGSYYEYIKDVIETSLNNFLSDTTFPYSVQSSKGGGMMMGGGNFGGGMPDGVPDDENAAEMGGAERETRIEDIDGIARTETTNTDEDEDATYNTPQEYIDSLNKNGEWVTYDSSTNTASITSVEDFVKNCKNASKSVGAFDDLDTQQGENTLFGYGDGNGAHFDPIMAELLKDTQYGEAYAEDLAKTDSLGNTVDYRMNMYTPLYYIMNYYDGYGSSDVAQYWRIRTGINQGDTALSTEVNLALALEQYGVDVDFETVWGMGHVEAERTGDSTENFIDWVNDCLK